MIVSFAEISITPVSNSAYTVLAPYAEERVHALVVAKDSRGDRVPPVVSFWNLIFAIQVPEILRVTEVSVVETVSLFMTNDQIGQLPESCVVCRSGLLDFIANRSRTLPCKLHGHILL